MFLIPNYYLNNPSHCQEFLSDHANFDTFGTALLTLFRATTGESYNGLMHDCMRLPNEFCPEPAGPGSCGSLWAVPYWLSFVVISQFTVMNLVIAAVLNEFAQVLYGLSYCIPI